MNYLGLPSPSVHHNLSDPSPAKHIQLGLCFPSFLTQTPSSQLKNEPQSPPPLSLHQPGVKHEPLSPSLSHSPAPEVIKILDCNDDFMGTCTGGVNGLQTEHGGHGQCQWTDKTGAFTGKAPVPFEDWPRNLKTWSGGDNDSDKENVIPVQFPQA